MASEKKDLLWMFAVLVHPYRLACGSHECLIIVDIIDKFQCILLPDPFSHLQWDGSGYARLVKLAIYNVILHVPLYLQLNEDL